MAFTGDSELDLPSAEDRNNFFINRGTSLVMTPFSKGYFTYFVIGQSHSGQFNYQTVMQTNWPCRQSIVSIVPTTESPTAMSASKFYLDSNDVATTYKIDFITITSFEVQRQETFITIPQFLNSEPDMCPLTFSLSSSMDQLISYSGDITLSRTEAGDLKFRIPLPTADKLSNDTFTFFVHAVNRDGASEISD